jgi:alkanesulfonate monooxygenase SsuD/methylene tetrahydromethanopterin reductase-like flavin-dependent oxidoreductase (luciferase family)
VAKPQVARLIAGHLELLKTAENLGFDGVCLPEHHQWPGSLTPAPMLLAAALSQATTKLQLAVLTSALALGDPLRAASEGAMLDVLSQGRYIAGFTVGHDGDAYALQVEPTRAQERFREGLELVLKAWTSAGPFLWHSPNLYYRYVNPWPLPVQQPHPPIWVMEPGSPLTLEAMARRNVTFLPRPGQGLAGCKHAVTAYRAAAERVGATVTSDHIFWPVLVYVGESDAAARAEITQPLSYLTTHLVKNPPTAPGLEPVAGQVTRLKQQQSMRLDQRSPEELRDGGWVVFGGPATVRQQLEAGLRDLGASALAVQFAIGSLSLEQQLLSMERFARDVRPGLRP